MNKQIEIVLSAAVVAVTLVTVGCSKAPESTATLPANSAIDANVSDIEVTEHVKTALHQNEALKGTDITVVTLKGDVRLTGAVDNQAQKDEALKVARAADGIHAIHDELTIKK